MSEAKHTPGPWREVRDAQGICGLLHPEKSGVAVAWFTDVHSPAKGFVGDEEPVQAGIPEREANARLIAAAPDLLWALKQIIGDLPSNRDWIDPVVEGYAKEAIAKAEGRS